MKKQAKQKLLICGFVLLLLAAAAAAVLAYRKCAYEFKKASHPLEYTEYVEKYAKEYEFDPYLLYAVIKTESGFECEAVSGVGARGLMQIMEETFDWIQYRLGEEDLTVYDDMFDPETNIRYGAYLMDYLLEKFDSVPTAAAAYHSGAGCVGEWLADRSLSSDGKTLDKIPSSAADHYVDKILNAYEAYRELYAEN